MLAALVIICAVTSADTCEMQKTDPVFQTEEACNQTVNAWLARSDKALKARLHGPYSAAIWCREIKGVES
jgi:hypothetical protein